MRTNAQPTLWEIITKITVRVCSPKALLFRWAIKPDGGLGDEQLKDLELKFEHTMDWNGDV